MSVPKRITHWKGLSLGHTSGISGVWGMVVWQLHWCRRINRSDLSGFSFVLGVSHLQDSWVSGRNELGLDSRKRLELRAACWQFWMVWDGMTLVTYVSRWLGDTQHPSFLHSLIFCTISVPLCLFILGLGFVSKLRAQGKAFSNLRAPGDVLGKADSLTHHSIN